MREDTEEEVPPSRLDPGPLMQLSTAYWDAQTLLTANRIGLFDRLAEGSKRLEDLANELDIAKRPARLFLNACCALGLLEARDGRFGNTALSNTFLVSTSPAYLGEAFRYSDDLYATWGKLEQALRTDAPVLAEETYLGEDIERTRHFVYGMHNRAMGIGQAMVGLYDLSGRRAMLDIGGGPGTYSAIYTERYPGLKSEVLDLPAVVQIAEEIIDSLDAAERVGVLPGDYRVSEFPAGKDVVLISGVFHRESAAGCQILIDKASRCLVPGGVLLIGDVFTQQGGTAPRFATLFGLNMMLTAPDGCVHEDRQVAQWMSESGFKDIEIHPFPPPMPHRLVVGVKA